MPELSLTGWLDPAVKYFADTAGIPVDDYSSRVGGEGIGSALELVADFFTKGWFNKLIQFGAGAISAAYATWGSGVPKRLRDELLTIGWHELFRIIEITPAEASALQASVFSSTRAAQKGDWSSFLATILKTPAEMGLPTAPPPTPIPAPAQAPIPSPPVAPTPPEAAPTSGIASDHVTPPARVGGALA
jgi:hypothetical protein